jgi:hypothetical protein
MSYGYPLVIQCIWDTLYILSIIKSIYFHIMNRNIIFSALISGALALSFGQVVYADITIDGQVYSDAWIAAHPVEVAQYIAAHPENAAAIAASAPASTQAAIYNAYQQQTGSTMSFSDAQAWANQTAATKSATVVVVDGQAYTNEWIIANAATVGKYIASNPSYAATILRNASPSSIEAVRIAYNKANPTAQLTADQAKTLIDQNAFFTPAWLAANPGTKDPWNDHSGPANDSQVKLWLSQNPNLTPAQIVDTMQKYGISINQFSRASGKPVQDIMKIANDAGISNEELSKRGILSAMNFADTRNNVWWAVQAGVLNKGIMCALFFIDQGKINPDCREYSQADMNIALSYQKNGYWGPTGTGDPYTELKKAGLISNGSYIGPNRWGTGNTGASTGPNIAGTNFATTYTPVATLGKLPVYTPTANSISCAEYNMSSNFACRGDLTVGTRVGDTKTYTSAEIKAFFSGNPSISEIIAKAVSLKFTTSDVAKALAIAGIVNAFDPNAIVNYVKELPGYALGPDNIIVKLKDGETKRASDGLLEGTWSSNPGKVSYTDWARAWYCTGAGDVNGGNVDYGATGGIAKNRDCGSYAGVLTGKATTTVTGVTTIPKTTQITPIESESDTESSSCIEITQVLKYQSKDATTNGAVTLLQNFLHATNYLPSVATGFFGAGTLKAVKAFQKANGFTQTGATGPNTRAKIKEISCSSEAVADSLMTLPDTAISGNLPEGCTSASGFSSVTGVKCVSTLPEGCTGSTNFSPVTGAKCIAQ